MCCCCGRQLEYNDKTLSERSSKFKKKTDMKKILAFFAAFVLLTGVLAGVALAQPTTLATLPDFADTNAVFTKIQNVTNVVFTALLITSVFIGLFAAFKFVTGGEKGPAEARSMLMWAGIGVIVAMLARGLPVLVKGLLQ